MWDKYGQSVVTSRDLRLTKLFFDLTDFQHEKLQRAFEMMDALRYDLFNQLEEDFPGSDRVCYIQQEVMLSLFKLLLQDKKILKELITHYLEVLNKFMIWAFDLKVRLEGVSAKKPLWYCLDARRTAT